MVPLEGYLYIFKFVLLNFNVLGRRNFIMR